MSATTTAAASRIHELMVEPFATYAPNDDVPLGGYGALMASYALGFGAFLGIAERKLPERIGFGDLALLGVATHTLTWLLAKDKVTSALRAPFVTYEGCADAGEVEEKPRGTGLRRAVGELVTCPYCLGPWVASAMVGAFVFKPRLARAAAASLAVVAISSFLHQAYAALKKQS